MRVSRLPPMFALALIAVLGAATPASARSATSAIELPSVFVRVIDAVNGMPVAGAEVLVSFVGGDPDRPIVTGTVYNGSTNGGGHALFKGLRAGAYVVSISADGYVSFGDGAHGDRLPTGLSVVFGGFRQGAGASSNVGVRVTVQIVPVTRGDCRP